MSANIEAKKLVVEEIKKNASEAKSIVLVNYQGLTVAEDTEFRGEFRNKNVVYKVLKNTLVKRAFDELGIAGFDADLNGPTAVAFAEDETSAAKIVVDAAKKYQDKISVKSGYVDGKYVDIKGIVALASIPSREELYGKLAGLFSGFPRSLACALNAVAEQKQA